MKFLTHALEDPRWYDILVQGRPVLIRFGTEFSVTVEAIRALGHNNFTLAARLQDDNV